MKEVRITDENCNYITFKLRKNNKYISTNLTQKATRLCVRKIISYLTDEEKLLLKRKKIEEKSTAEIAKELNLSERSIRHKLMKLDNDIDDIIDRLITSKYRHKLTKEEAVIYEYYYMYRYTISHISEILNVDRVKLSYTIKIIEAKMSKNNE